MNTTAFDTLRFAQALQEDNLFAPRQAERLSTALSAAIGEDQATKTDLMTVRTTLQGEIADVKTTLRTEIANVKTSLQAEIAALKTSLQTEIRDGLRDLAIKFETSKSETLKWIMGLIGFQSLAMFGAAVVLARWLRP